MKIQNYADLIDFSTNETGKKARQVLLDSFKTAIDAVDPYKIVFDNLSVDHENETLAVIDDNFDMKNRKIWIIGAGKAVGRMAEALEAVLDGLNIRGAICVPLGVKKDISLKQIECLECSHPLPSETNIQNTKQVMNLVKKIKADDLVIALISGGGSAIWSAPIFPITVEDLISLNKLLINSGMSIHEINTIRKHVSLIKGGKLSEKISSSIIVLVLSDVIGDNLEIIASGPFYPDPSTFQESKSMLMKYKLWDKSIPSSVKLVIDQGIEGKISETQRKRNGISKKVLHYILGSNELACKAALNHAKKLGFKTKYDSNLIKGEARKLGRSYAEKHSTLVKNQNNAIFLVSGGEPTMKVRGSGIGGRNQEVAGAYLQFFLNSREISKYNSAFLAVGTDGIDGNSQYAGVLIDKDTLDKSNQIKSELNMYQKNNDLTSFFELVGGSLVLTGPTGTNVMDLHLGLVNTSEILLSNSSK
ncbi:MAG: glycerate kinase [Candidatus Hodarchaeota archaeon]